MVVNLAQILKRIDEAASRSGRDPRSITVLAVTKRSVVPEIKEAIRQGIRVIGESQVLEAIDKFRSLPPVEKHMIGHLQTNKVKAAVQYFDVIQSLDSWKLALEIDRRAKDLGKIMAIMIEIRFEEQKHGIPPEEAADFYRKLLTLTNIKAIGLMTVAPLVPAEQTRKCFKRMAELKMELGLWQLSMGMSNDFEVAIEEGSTMVRLGRVLFG